MIYFTADTHFNHKNIIKYCKRPFGDIDKMNSVLIKNWNAKIKENERVYHLGDFGFGNLEDILKSLNGRKILILGSHDRDTLKFEKYFEKISPLLEIKEESISITLCHYAMRVWPKSHYNSWHLFGHSHGRLEPVGKSLDVGVDVHNFYPIGFDEVKGYMNKREDNFNLTRL